MMEGYTLANGDQSMSASGDLTKLHLVINKSLRVQRGGDNPVPRLRIAL
jgi:hypothetical protein